MNSESSLLIGRLLFWRQAFIDLKQKCLVSSSERVIKQRSVSEMEARRWLWRTYDMVRRHRDESRKSLQWRYKVDVEHGAVRSYFLGERTKNAPMFELLDVRFWNDYAVFIRKQIQSSQRAEQTFGAAYCNVHRLLDRSIFNRFFKHFFMPQLEFITHDAKVIRQYKSAVEMTYFELVGFTAANIAAYPELERSMHNARPDLDTTAALVTELSGIVAQMIPALVKTELELAQLPKLAAARIQEDFYVPKHECLTGQVIDVTPSLDPEEIVIARDEARHFLENLSLQQQLIVVYMAEGYKRLEIAQALDVGAESIKEQTARLRYNARSLRAA